MVVEGSTHPAISHTAPIYQFRLDFQKITWIPPPSIEPCHSKSQQGSGQLKLTVLYGTEQHEIGTFEILHDECTIDQQLSCRVQCSKSEDLGKLHVYVDEACCSGLAGHIAVDLKEFFDERDCEVHVEYPMHAANAYGFRAAKFTMSIQCDRLNQENIFRNLDCETIIQWSPKQSRLPSLHDTGSDANTLDTVTGSVQCMLVRTPDCNRDQTDVDCQEGSEEVQLLKDVESILSKLNAKLTSVVAPYTLEDGLLGQPLPEAKKQSGRMPYVHVAAFVLAGFLSKLHVQYRHPSFVSLTLSKPGEHILPADSLPVLIKEAAPECTWPRPSFVPTSKCDCCSPPEDELYRDSCGSPCGTKSDIGPIVPSYQEEVRYQVTTKNEVRDHLQAGRCADCFLCTMRSSDKYEALFSCLSSSSEGSETSPTTSCESSNGCSCSDEDDASVQNGTPGPRRSSAIFQTIFRVVLIAGAAVLGLKAVSFAKRKGRTWSPVLLAQNDGRDQDRNLN